MHFIYHRIAFMDCKTISNAYARIKWMGPETIINLIELLLLGSVALPIKCNGMFFFSFLFFLSFMYFSSCCYWHVHIYACTLYMLLIQTGTHPHAESQRHIDVLVLDQFACAFVDVVFVQEMWQTSNWQQPDSNNNNNKNNDYTNKKVYKNIIYGYVRTLCTL